MSLRDYQAVALERARAAVAAGRRRILLTMPCLRGGKGHLAAALVASSVAKSKRVLFVVHRRELVPRLERARRRHGIKAGVVLPGYRAQPDLAAQVASIQTLSRRTLPPPTSSSQMSVTNASSTSWRAVLDAYPDAVVVGFSATPCRLSGAPLGDIFEELIQVTTPAELVELGFLVPMQGWSFASPNLARIPPARGDFDQGALQLVMGSPKVLGYVVREYQERAAGTRAIVFAVNVEHSLRLTEHSHAGAWPPSTSTAAPAETSATPSSSAYRTGETRVLCNVSLFTEGVDLPSIVTVILARPTASLSLYLQMLGAAGGPSRVPAARSPTGGTSAAPAGARSPSDSHASTTTPGGLPPRWPDEPRIWTLDKPVRVTRLPAAPRSGLAADLHVLLRALRRGPAGLPDVPGVNRSVLRLVRNGDGVAVPLEDGQAARRPGPRRLPALADL
jgi:superfamily II DNA or RNA helicase